MLVISPLSPFKVAVELGLDVVASGGLHVLKLEQVIGFKLVLKAFKGLEVIEALSECVHS